MAQTNLLAFPKQSHSSINSPLIHKGSCSILGTATERRATRNRVSSVERVAQQKQGPVVEENSPGNTHPNSLCFFSPTFCQHSHQLKLNQSPEGKKARCCNAQGKMRRVEGRGYGPRRTQRSPFLLRLSSRLVSVTLTLLVVLLMF